MFQVGFLAFIIVDDEFVFLFHIRRAFCYDASMRYVSNGPTRNCAVTGMRAVHTFDNRLGLLF